MNRFALFSAAAGLAVATLAHAQSRPIEGYYPETESPASALTRAEVMADVAAARQAGVLGVDEGAYPVALARGSLKPGSLFGDFAVSSDFARSRPIEGYYPDTDAAPTPSLAERDAAAVIAHVREAQ